MFGWAVAVRKSVVNCEKSCCDLWAWAVRKLKVVWWKITGTVSGQWGPPLITFSIYFELFGPVFENLSAGGCLSCPPALRSLCWRMNTRQYRDNLCRLKVASCRSTHQQRPLLASNTNRFWRSAGSKQRETWLKLWTRWEELLRKARRLRSDIA
jgi:hypothetical protein